jgi:hypothetical protein
MHNDIDYAIARALLATHPTLCSLLVDLVRAGQSTAQIMARVNRITRGSLTAMPSRQRSSICGGTDYEHCYL